MAEVRTQQGRFAEAVTLREKHVAVAPHPENRYELGVALERAGRDADARQEWAAFEEAARAGVGQLGLRQHRADLLLRRSRGRPADALALARREAARRQDVRTLEALAWALHRNGQSTTARKEIDKVLAVGVAQPETFAHAAAIAAAQGDAGPRARMGRPQRVDVRRVLRGKGGSGRARSTVATE